MVVFEPGKGDALHDFGLSWHQRRMFWLTCFVPEGLLGDPFQHRQGGSPHFKRVII
jgi:hypothetical protein